MIGHLQGRLHELRDDSIILDVAGVGYEVHLSKLTLGQLPPVGNELALTIATIVREDAISLYGFLSPLEKQLFNLLTSVSGIGPRQATNILSNATVGQLIQS